MRVPDRLPGPRSILRGVLWVVLACGLLLVAVVSVPQLAGADHSYVVVSDSMAPTLEAGDSVLVKDVPAEEIAAGDVITFRRGDRGQRTTHRVVEVVTREDRTLFRTKGDANEDPDRELVPARSVVGEVSLHVPYAGHFLLFAQSKTGTLLLVILPAAALVASETWNLYAGLRGEADDGTAVDDEEGAE